MVYPLCMKHGTLKIFIGPIKLVFNLVSFNFYFLKKFSSVVFFILNHTETPPVSIFNTIFDILFFHVFQILLKYMLNY